MITDYLVSVGDLYGPALNQPWPAVVAAVGRQVRDVIDREGHFLTRVAHPAAALCSPVQRSAGLRDGVPTVQPRRPVNRPVTPIENGETTSRASRAR